MFPRFTERVRKVMELANDETCKHNSQLIGPRHILLGILKNNDGVGIEILKKLGYDLKGLSEVVTQDIPKGIVECVGKVPLSPASEKVMEIASNYARDNNHNYLGTEHLLYALLKDDVLREKYFLGLNLEEYTPCLNELFSINDKEKEFYKLPRSVGIEGLLIGAGFKLEPLKNTSMKNCFDINYPDTFNVGKLYPDAGDASGIIIDYNLGDLKQLEKALDLKSILDINSIKYESNKSPEEISQSLNQEVQERTRLIERLR